MTTVRQLALPLMVIAMMSTAPSSVMAQPVFEGVYIASGADSDGITYQRAVEIERHGDRYLITWVSARFVGGVIVLEPIWVGIGIVTDDILSVSFIADYGGGVMVYRPGPNGHLIGRWTLDGDDDEICSETLTPLFDEVSL